MRNMKEYQRWILRPHRYVVEEMKLDIPHDKFDNLFNMGTNLGGYDAWNHLSWIMDYPHWSNEFLNFSLGPLAVLLKEHEAPLRKTRQFFHHEALIMLYKEIDEGRIDKKMHRDIEVDLLMNFNDRFGHMIEEDEGLKYAWKIDNNPPYVEDFRLAFYESVIAVTEKEMNKAGGSELDEILTKLIEDNPDQFAAAKEKPKLANWFVGQVMKATNGQADAADVREKVAGLLS